MFRCPSPSAGGKTVMSSGGCVMGVFVLFVVYMVCLYVLFIHGCEERLGSSEGAYSWVAVHLLGLGLGCEKFYERVEKSRRVTEP